MSEFIILTLTFLSSSLLSIILSHAVDLSTILKILSVTVLVLLIGMKVGPAWLPHGKIKNKIIKSAGLFVLSLFIFLIVVSTGGILSPLFFTIHISIIAISFLLTFPIAMAFLCSSLIALLFEYLRYDPHLRFADPAFLVIQIASLSALIPFSLIVSTRYHLKGRLADYLLNELFLSQKEESLIFENIEEGVITLNKKFAVVKMNKVAENLSGYKSLNVVGRDFFEIFKFFDHDKNIIQKEHFPVKDFLAKQSGFAESVLLQKPNGLLTNIDFKFSSILGPKGTVESFLFVFNPKELGATGAPVDTVLLQAFKKFSELLTKVYSEADELEASAGQHVTWEATLPQLNKDLKRISHAYKNLEILYKLSTNSTPGLLFDQDVENLVRKVIYETTDLAKEYGVALINSTPLSPPLPIKFNKIIFEQVVSKIIELGVFIAARSPEKFVIVSTGSSPENIFVSVKISSFNNFPWEQASELIKPFFGTLENRPELSQASGLEGYLAESLLKEKNIEGGITGGKFEDNLHNLQLILTIILPYLKSSKI